MMNLCPAWAIFWIGWYFLFSLKKRIMLSSYDEFSEVVSCTATWSGHWFNKFSRKKQKERSISQSETRQIFNKVLKISTRRSSCCDWYMASVTKIVLILYIVELVLDITFGITIAFCRIFLYDTALQFSLSYDYNDFFRQGLSDSKWAGRLYSLPTT